MGYVTVGHAVEHDHEGYWLVIAVEDESFRIGPFCSGAHAESAMNTFEGMLLRAGAHEVPDPRAKKDRS